MQTEKNPDILQTENTPVVPQTENEPVVLQTENRPVIAQMEKKPATFWERHKEKKARQKEKEKNKTLAQKIMSWVWTILAAVIIATLVRAFVAEPIRVDGTSMTNTLKDGEIVLATKWDYLLGEPQRNDIVICRYPGRMNERGANQITISAALSLDVYTLFVKRLVALPGDTVQITGGHLYVNGELVEDPEFMASVPTDYSLRTLGADEYFVIGDNRYSSHDSRASDVGPISRTAIMGKVKFVILPWGQHRSVE
ncbi:MAG: signal peptidase I [Clostridia bacterium]|nr:signal peptidase I [Clostridia bacterium]